jgi:hypothetical protein
MSSAVICGLDTENRKGSQAPISDYVISGSYRFGQTAVVLTTVELLSRLEEKGVKNADIARALNVTPSRITEMKKGERAIKLDEAAKLVARFDLESPPAQRVAPIPAPVSRLIVRYVAEELGCRAEENHLQDIAEDVRAFAEFVADPSARGSIEMAEMFFQAMRLRRSTVEAEGQQ